MDAQDCVGFDVRFRKEIMSKLSFLIYIEIHGHIVDCFPEVKVMVA